jgi:hypothetical protein
VTGKKVIEEVVGVVFVGAVFVAVVAAAQLGRRDRQRLHAVELQQCHTLLGFARTPHDTLAILNVRYDCIEALP